MTTRFRFELFAAETAMGHGIELFPNLNLHEKMVMSLLNKKFQTTLKRRPLVLSSKPIPFMESALESDLVSNLAITYNSIDTCMRAIVDFSRYFTSSVPFVFRVGEMNEVVRVRSKNKVNENYLFYSVLYPFDIDRVWGLGLFTNQRIFPTVSINTVIHLYVYLLSFLCRNVEKFNEPFRTELNTLKKVVKKLIVLLADCTCNEKIIFSLQTFKTWEELSTLLLYAFETYKK